MAWADSQNYGQHGASTAACMYIPIYGLSPGYLVEFSKMDQVTWFCTKWDQVTGFAKIVDQVTWETKCEDQITSTTILQKWTRLPGGPDYLVAAKSGPDYLVAASWAEGARGGWARVWSAGMPPTQDRGAKRTRHQR